MIYQTSNGGALHVDFDRARITALTYAGHNILADEMPLFTLRLLAADGDKVVLTAADATVCTPEENGATYTGFAHDVTVRVTLEVKDADLIWGISVENGTDMLVEWVDFPSIRMKPLKGNGGIGEVLFPYNEGALVSDIQHYNRFMGKYREIEYPSLGAYHMFPNMMCSQFMAYLFDGHGFYMGAHDPVRGPKAVTLKPEEGDTFEMRIRYYCGVGYGENFATDFPIVWKFFDGVWEDAADIYRAWFEQHLPRGAKKISENKNLPEWYEDSPLVVTYPVRGYHVSDGSDDMEPNALIPYTNALPLLDDIAERVKSRLLILLIRWEGTAPWAPPYVWPPLGGEESFLAFRDELHKRRHMLGVYCSGFGYTLQSHLVKSHNCEKEYEERGLREAMCVGPADELSLSGICPEQRTAYDVCPVSKKGREVLDEAYDPLFKSGIDYTQILDQNHGGGQYFCYSEHHGHAPAPGPWMTTRMQEMLSDWNATAGKMLFGSESAAGEPFIGNILFSDNRFELCWKIGRPVPMYAYIYHEYLRNFMGNQVAAPFPAYVDTFRHRMAYAFAAGDCLTLIMRPADGGLFSDWGNHDLSNPPDRDKALDFAAHLTSFYHETAKPYLYNGRMIRPLAFTATDYPTYNDCRRIFPPVYSTAWEAEDGSRAQIFVNANETPVTLEVEGHGTLVVPASDAVIIPLH
ncbi:MAG: hypothetical protein J6R04_07130 [Clostridia bacterium]|nr:hypothetical protein [Clostridia bacterium]